MAPGWSLVTKRPSHDLKLGNFSLIPHPLEREELLEMELVIDYVYLRESPYNPVVENLENSQVGENVRTNRMIHPGSTGTDAPV